MKMKNTTKAALIALTSALLICATSCLTPDSTDSKDACDMAKSVKDSIINAGTTTSLETKF